jgi:hypothetical protein
MLKSTAPTLAIVPAPLDALAIPAALDGRDGANRATNCHAQIAATNDLDALRAWLARFPRTSSALGTRMPRSGAHRSSRLAEPPFTSRL